MRSTPIWEQNLRNNVTVNVFQIPQVPSLWKSYPRLRSQGSTRGVLMGNWALLPCAKAALT